MNTTPNERDREVAEDVASSANIVTCDGYYEIDIDAVEIVIATYRAEIEAAARADERAKIVAFARKQSVFYGPDKSANAIVGEWSEAIDVLADAIESGEIDRG